MADFYQQSTTTGPTPYNRSFSSSGSFQNSSGNSSSSSGDYYLPYQRSLIDALLPQVQNRLKGANPAAVQATPFSSYLLGVGGGAGNFPEVSPSPVWSEGMIGQRVNQMRAQNQAEAGGQLRDTAQRLSGAGFQAQSPLYQELAGGIQGRALAASAGAENDLRFQAAQGNAQNVLRGQQLGIESATARAQDERSRRASALAARAQDLETSANRENALLQALGYYARPLQRSQSQSQQQSKAGSSSYSQSESGQTSSPLMNAFTY